MGLGYIYLEATLNLLERQAINKQMGWNHSKATILTACSQLIRQLLDCLFILCVNTPDFAAQVEYLTTGCECESFV